MPQLGILLLLLLFFVLFLSPARSGRGILVVPGFCPASRFLVGAKTIGQIFLKFQHDILRNMGVCN